ncbi:MAG TPA: methyltransferase domain-containing protein [Herpetosiphonaceae bacterium]|nr:methyltransferase domain-containing protein [Herpetosiphonaceae bacterium]
MTTLPCPPRPLPFAARAEARERLDDIAHETPELRQNLRDMYRLTGLLRVWRRVEQEVLRLAAGVPGPARVVDVGAGGADAAIALARFAGRSGRRFRVTALDAGRPIARIARRNVAAHPEVEVVVADGCSIPARAATFDVAVCAMTLHHLSEPDAVVLLRELDRVTSRGFVVVDLRRGPAAFAGAWLATRLLTRNRLSRYDGPLSVRRAFSLDEMRHLVGASGIENAVVVPHFPATTLVVQTKVADGFRKEPRGANRTMSHDNRLRSSSVVGRWTILKGARK